MSGLTRTDGTFTVEFVVGTPEKACPCVVHVTSPDTSSKVDVPFDLGKKSTGDDVRADDEKVDTWVPPIKPKGYKAWSYRGVEVYLSKFYKLNAWDCGMPQDTTVIVGDYPTTCSAGPGEGSGGVYDAGIVALLPAESESAKEHIPNLTKRVNIGGVTAYVDSDCKKCTGSNLLGASAMYFPKQRVVVATDQQIIEVGRDILATVHVVG